MHRPLIEKINLEVKKETFERFKKEWQSENKFHIFYRDLDRSERSIFTILAATLLWEDL